MDATYNPHRSAEETAAMISDINKMAMRKFALHVGITLVGIVAVEYLGRKLDA